jgi:ADP-ribose pyrophosphatase
MNLKLLNRKYVYQGKVFDVIVDEVMYPSGRKTVREIADHPGGSVAVALFPDERIILVKQHRYPFDEVVWECPAGKLNKGEDPLVAAKREFEEETGYQAATWKKLTAMYPTPGFCNEIDYIYLATNLSPVAGGHRREEGEQTMQIEILPFAQALEMIDNQEIVDAKTICGILLADRVLHSQ